MTVFRVPAFCPDCLWRPALHLYPELILWARDLDPLTPLISQKCQRRGCGTVYAVTALDLQRSIEVRGKREAA